MMYRAASDRDYADECHGPYPRTVVMTCEACHEDFRAEVTRGEEPDRICARCENVQRAAHERQVIRCARCRRHVATHETNDVSGVGRVCQACDDALVAAYFAARFPALAKESDCA